MLIPSTKFTLKDLKGWLKLGGGFYLLTYIVISTFYLCFSGTNSFWEIFHPAFFLGILVINIIFYPIVFIIKQAFNLFKRK